MTLARFSMPSLAAIWSAVRKPMPRMSRARRYGYSEISRRLLLDALPGSRISETVRLPRVAAN